MKSRQLLSVVLSLIMVFGVSTGSAFAQTDDDVDDSIEVTGIDNMTSETEEAAEKADEAIEDTVEEEAEKAEEEDELIEEAEDVYDLDDKLERFCEMSDEDKRKFFAGNPRLEQFSERIENYCEMSEDERDDAIENFVEEHKTDLLDYIKENKMGRMHGDKPHMDYDRLCALSESDRALEVDDSEKLERLDNWCEMTPEEREDYKEEHHDEMKEKHNEMKEKHRERMSELSPRLKEMIMDKRDMSDERREEIKAKYAEKYGDLTDEDKSELKKKFKKHMSSIRSDISDDRKSEIQERIAEMKAFKSELREKAADMTDHERQQLREEFIEKAKDMQLAWISPRVQITAGIDAADVECREGFSLVMKASNGVPMCLKADTALKMIDRGIAVPAN